ncbi:MAG: hypothetical protein BVN35_06180 [Proteobacteria bacterium ST_bin11]|nr:MAG: hypothetical protein BVN35_06180 [Proteobacteria bacterium ST_bin11]
MTTNDKDDVLGTNYFWFVCLLGYVKGLHKRSSKTENRTLLAVTMYPYRLRRYMNTGEDRSLNVSVFKSFKQLKRLEDDAERVGNPEDLVVHNKFDIICMLGPIQGQDVAFSIVDTVYKSRGERSRRKALKSSARSLDIMYVVNRERKATERINRKTRTKSEAPTSSAVSRRYKKA